MPAEPPPPLCTRLALPTQRRRQRQPSLCRAQPELRCLLARWKKAKTVRSCSTPLTFCNLGQHGSPGADLRAAARRAHGHRRTSPGHRCARAGLESRWVSPAHTTYTSWCLPSPPLKPIPSGSVETGGAQAQTAAEGRSKALPLPDAFAVPLAGVHVCSCLGSCLGGGWQGICAKTISDLFKKKVTNPSIVSGKTVCFSFKHRSAGNLNTVSAGKSERESEAVKH